MNNEKETIDQFASAMPLPNSDFQEFTPNNPPWSSAVAFLTWIGSVILLVFVPGIILLPYLLSIRNDFPSSEALMQFASTDKTALLIQIVGVIPAHILTLVMAYFVVTQGRKYSFFKMLGMRWGGFNWIYTIGVMLLIFLFAISMTSIFGESENEFMKMLKSSRSITLWVAAIATFFAPVVEEVIYRGILYSAFRRTFGVPLALAIVTFIFASVHFPQYWGDWATISSLLGLSLILGIVREKTGNLLPCIFLHFLINGIQSAYLVLEPYILNYI